MVKSPGRPSPQEGEQSPLNKAAAIATIVGTLLTAMALIPAFRQPDSYGRPLPPTSERPIGARDGTTSSAESASPTAPYTPPVRRQGTVTLISGGMAIDLNAPASSKNWNASTDHYEADRLYYTDAIPTLMGYEVQFAQLDSPAKATFQTCSEATTYQSMSNGVEQLREGPRLCLMLASGRHAAVDVTSKSERELALKITVWE